MAELEDVATQTESSDAPEKTLREELEASVEAIEERETGERARGPDGKFVSAKADEPVEVKADKAEKPAISVQTEQVEPSAPANVPSLAPNLAAAPSSWSNAAKAKWAALDPDLRAEIGKREADVHKGFTKMDEERAFAKQMQQVVAPYEAVIRAAGTSVPAAVQSVLNTAYILRTADPATKAQAIRQVCEQYGIDIGSLSQQQNVDPALSATQQRLAQLEQQLQQQTNAQAQAAQFEVQSAIDTFAQDPKHVHFEHVKTQMGALMQSGAAQSLDDAYDMAVWARPDLRAALLAEHRQQQQAADAQKAKQARAKGVSVRGGPGGTPTVSTSDRSLREELEANMAAASGRI
jgi:hypothetical protein